MTKVHFDYYNGAGTNLPIQDLEILGGSFLFRVKNSHLPDPTKNPFHNSEWITFVTEGEEPIHFENNNSDLPGFEQLAPLSHDDTVLFSFKIVKPKIKSKPFSLNAVHMVESPVCPDAVVKPPFFEHFPTLNLLIHDPSACVSDIFRVEVRNVHMYEDKVMFKVDGEFATTIQNAKRLFLKNEYAQRVFHVDSVSNIRLDIPSQKNPTYSVTLKGTPVNPEEMFADADTPGLSLTNRIGCDDLTSYISLEECEAIIDKLIAPKSESLADAMASFNKRNL